jgi:hypothetical protein
MGVLTTEGELLDALMEDEGFRAEYQRHLLFALVHGRQGFGKGYAAKRKMLDSMDLGKMGVGTLQADPPTKLPQKICRYGKDKVEWYGSRPLDAIKNITGTRGGQTVMHWAVTADTVARYVPRTPWVPQDQLFISSGKPLKINDKSEENN